MTKKLDNLKEDGKKFKKLEALHQTISVVLWIFFFKLLEIRELESVIHTYARPLYSKWESIKNTQKPEVLENFMNEVSVSIFFLEMITTVLRSDGSVDFEWAGEGEGKGLYNPRT